MTRRFFALALTLAATLLPGVHAQNISISTSPDSDQIGTWLRSGDPRLVAWGAYFTGKQHDVASLALLPRMMEQWTAPSDSSSIDARPPHSEMISVIDTVIATHTPVSTDAVRNIADIFPAEASILVARMPLPEAIPVLLDWYAKRTARNVYLTPRIAAMLLSQAPTPAFAQSILSESEEHLTINVTSKEGGQFVGAGSSCGDGIGAGSPPDWPPLFSYTLEENSSAKDPPVLLAIGGDRITYRKHSFYGGDGSCFYVAPLNFKNRHHLIAKMLATDDKNIPWKFQDGVSIVWQSQDQFLTELNKAVVQRENAMRETVHAFIAKNLLPSQQATEVRPKLAIRLSDQREGHNPPLPQPAFADSRTYFQIEDSNSWWLF